MAQIAIACSIGDERLFGHIKAGRKTTEGRILVKGGDGVWNKWNQLRPGQFVSAELSFGHQEETVVRRVKSTKIYATFEEMLEGEGLERVLPDEETIEGAATRYKTEWFPGWEAGVEILAIRI